MQTHNIGHTLAREVRVQRRKARARVEGQRGEGKGSFFNRGALRCLFHLSLASNRIEQISNLNHLPLKYLNLVHTIGSLVLQGELGTSLGE